MQRWTDAGTSRTPPPATELTGPWLFLIWKPQDSGPGFTCTSGSAIRITFGVIFAIDAYLKWLPSFTSSFQGQVTGAAQGQPGWLMPWFHFWAHWMGTNPEASCLQKAGRSSGLRLVTSAFRPFGAGVGPRVHPRSRMRCG
jgi:hypothetical protein